MFTKKLNLFLFIFIFFGSGLFAQNYKISNIDYEIKDCGLPFFGVTRKYALEKEVPVDFERVFTSKEELDSYIEDYKLRLNNTRAFETVEVSYKIENESEVLLSVKLTDSFHMLAIPYGRYDSNKGIVFKLKYKDTNFLGTLSPLTTDLNFIIEQEDEMSNPDYKFGFNFNYDYPFKLGAFDAKWTNDHAFSYTIGDSSPEWNLNTGLSFSLPYDNFSLVFDFTQSFAHNYDYSSFDDEYYFTEKAQFSIPINVYTIENWGNIVYKPYITFLANWDYNGIEITNTNLSSPIVSLSHSISTSRVNWINNYRNGLDLNLINSFEYNFQRNIMYPSITADFKFYKGFEFFEGNYLNRIGISSNIYAFAYLMDYSSNPYLNSDGKKIGEKLRGIRDEQLYSDANLGNACTVPAAIVLNLDMPFRLFETDFQWSFLKYLNFDLQISPFFDAALTYNKYTNKLFDPKDGFYTAGIEVLVYPKKLSSFTVRGSLGVDLGQKLFSNQINNEWRRNVSPYEIFIGVGLHY